MKKIHLFIYCLLITSTAVTQTDIYTDANNLITGTWHNAAGAGATSSLAPSTAAMPYEGSQHYQFTYNFSAWWAGFGLNLDNWGTSAGLDFSAYSHLRIAYKGLSGNATLGFRLKSGAHLGNDFTLGGAINDYTLVEIPLIALVIGTNVSLNDITEIEFFINGVQAANDQVYFDAIQLLNTTDVPSAASATTWARANSVTRGVNLANWLEAHWNIPFGTYPQVNKFTRSKIQALRQAGFEVFRLPVTFERITPTTAPYTVDFSHTSLQLVDSMILWAQEFDFDLIIDNHHGYELTNANFNTELVRVKAIWSQLASAYGHLDPNRYFFEIYNEPLNISNVNFRTFAQEVIDEIRAVETQTHSIIVGATSYNSPYELVNFIPLSDADIIYTFHTYTPYLFTHQGMSWTSPTYLPARTFPQAGEEAAIQAQFADVKAWSDNYNVPVWLGEYGVSYQADAVSRCNWMNTLTTAIQQAGFTHFYWDAITTNNAFGFFENNTINESNIITCFKNTLDLYNSPLPLNFLNAAVSCENSSTSLTWQIGEATNVAFFVIEASANASSWQQVTVLNYDKDKEVYNSTFAHTNESFYRIVALDFDGSKTYSSILQNHCLLNSTVLLYPNPAKDKLYIDWAEASFNPIENIDVFDVSGRLLQQIKTYNNSIGIDLSHLESAVYWLRLTSATGQIIHKRLVVSR